MQIQVQIGDTRTVFFMNPPGSVEDLKKLHIFSPKKLVQLSILKEPVKPSNDSKMIKLLTFDDRDL